jgi:aspartyl/glutamyl-tRNA(Asn/Gln) amidotransferase C subunit
MQDKEFDRLLKITRLRVSAEERVQIKSDFEQVIAYFDEISSLEADGEPAYHPVEIPGRLREDKVKPFADSESLKKRAKTSNGYIVGPKL